MRSRSTAARWRYGSCTASTPTVLPAHERYSFGVSQASVLPPHTGYGVRVYPAVHVISGSVTFNQWLTDTDLIVITR